MARSNRLRLWIFLIALLPGLLFRGGESLHVCLHDWIDFEDGCTGTAEVLASSQSSGGGCCSGDITKPDLPALVSDHDCQGCCIEVSVERAELTKPSSIDSGAEVCPPAPLELAAARWYAPPAPRLAPPAVVHFGPPPGRAPTPLRI